MFNIYTHMNNMKSKRQVRKRQRRTIKKCGGTHNSHVNDLIEQQRRILLNAFEEKRKNEERTRQQQAHAALMEEGSRARRMHQLMQPNPESINDIVQNMLTKDQSQFEGIRPARGMMLTGELPVYSAAESLVSLKHHASPSRSRSRLRSRSRSKSPHHQTPPYTAEEYNRIRIFLNQPGLTDSERKEFMRMRPRARVAFSDMTPHQFRVYLRNNVL